MIIAISHQKGGVGKSTIAYNIAVELNKKYLVDVADLDVQQTITACNIIRSKFKQKKLNILNFNNKTDFIDYLNNVDDNKIVVIDTGGFDSGMNRVAIYAADLIITPVSTEFLEIIGLEKYKKIIKEISKKINKRIKTHIILNKIHHAQQNFDDIKDFIKKSPEQFEILNSILRKRADYNVSLSHGFSVTEFNKKSDSAKEIKSLVNEISKLLDFKNNAIKLKDIK